MLDAGFFTSLFSRDLKSLTERFVHFNGPGPLKWAKTVISLIAGSLKGGHLPCCYMYDIMYTLAPGTYFCHGEWIRIYIYTYIYKLT